MADAMTTNLMLNNALNKETSEAINDATTNIQAKPDVSHTATDSPNTIE